MTSGRVPGYVADVGRGNKCYDKDDKEVDAIYEGIDEYMDEKCKKYRDKHLKKKLKRYHQERQEIQQKFFDLKQELVHINEDEWRNIPEIKEIKNPKCKSKTNYTIRTTS